MQKGHKHSDETRKKMREAASKRDNTARIAALPSGRKHWNWSENPNVLSLHKRIHRKYGPAKNYPCVRACGRLALDWALKPGREHTGKSDDYEPLCRKCHVAQDNHPSKVDRTRHKIIRDKKGRIKTTIIL